MNSWKKNIIFSLTFYTENGYIIDIWLPETGSPKKKFSIELFCRQLNANKVSLFQRLPLKNTTSVFYASMSVIQKKRWGKKIFLEENPQICFTL